MLVSPFDSSPLFPSWHDVDLFVKHIIYRFFLGPIHYDASHNKPVEASDGFVSIHINTETTVDTLNTLCGIPLQFVFLYMSELSVRY